MVALSPYGTDQAQEDSKRVNSCSVSPPKAQTDYMFAGHYVCVGFNASKRGKEIQKMNICKVLPWKRKTTDNILLVHVHSPVGLR